MDINQRVLVELLSSAIRGRKHEKPIPEGVNWKGLLEEAEAHDVDPLIYTLVENLEGDQSLDASLLTQWHGSALYLGMMQTRHEIQMNLVLNRFHEEGIPVIALKGLVLREFYPQPELRVMGDADILVHSAYYTRAQDLLTSIGYRASDSNPCHTAFVLKGLPVIELHWTLVNEDTIRSAHVIENSIWEKAVPSRVCGAPACVLSPADQLFHLCLHMAHHFVCTGFGLRQLCDLVLYLEARRDVIDWKLFGDRVKNSGIQRFSTVAFALCRRLFSMELDVPGFKPVNDRRYIDQMIQHVLSSGVHGNRNTAQKIENALIWDSNIENTHHPRNKAIQTLSVLFPPAGRLSKRYGYARNHPILTPVAWIHRFFHSFFRRDITILQKFSFLSVFNSRSRLIRWLELR